MTETFKLQVLFEGFNRTDNAFANIRKGVENTKGLFRTLGDQARGVFNLPNMIAGSAFGTGLKSFFDAGAKLESTKISMKVLLKGDDNAVNKLMKEWKTLGAKTNLEDEDIFGVGRMMLGFNAATKENVSQYASMLADLSGAAENPRQAFESIRALQMALSGLVPKSHLSLIHHSDRGIQYCSYGYVKLLQDNKIQISMTENGDPLENAVAERINGIIKQAY